MHLTPVLAINFLEGGLGVIGGIVVVVIILTLVVMIFSRYTKVGPNQVLIVSGMKHKTEDGSLVGFRIVKGGGTFVMPVFEKVDLLSLELLTIDVQTPEVYTSKGVPVKVDGVSQIKVKVTTFPSAPQRNNFSARAPTKSATSPHKRSKAICARSSAR